MKFPVSIVALTLAALLNDGVHCHPVQMDKRGLGLAKGILGKVQSKMGGKG